MELWIRSQDKERLIKVSNVQYTYRKGDLYSDVRGKHYIGTYYDNLEILGEYATKERALEVLDEIEERIMLINTINIVKDRDSLIACKNALTEEKMKGISYPYQMPEK